MVDAIEGFSVCVCACCCKQGCKNLMGFRLASDLICIRKRLSVALILSRMRKFPETRRDDRIALNRLSESCCTESALKQLQ